MSSSARDLLSLGLYLPDLSFHYETWRAILPLKCHERFTDLVRPGEFEQLRAYFLIWIVLFRVHAALTEFLADVSDLILNVPYGCFIDDNFGLRHWIHQR